MLPQHVHDERVEDKVPPDSTKYQHLYTRMQRTAPLQQRDAIPDVGSDDNPFNATLFGKAVQRAAHIIRRYTQLFMGEKPALPSGGGEGNKWRRQQIHLMAQKGQLLGQATDYYTLPAPVANVSYQASSARLILEGRKLADTLRKDSINARILGTNAYLSPTKLKQQHYVSDVFIAPPGDFRATIELAEIYKKKLNGVRLPPLIIQNTNREWDPLLADMQLLEYREGPIDESRFFIDTKKLKESYGIHITHSHQETLEVARTLCHGAPKKEKQGDERPFIPEGSTLFVATGTRKKYHELTQIYKKQGLKVNILPIDFLVDSYVSPKEDQGSYEGNAAKKIQAAFDAWGRIKKQETKLRDVGHRLFELGLQETDEPLDPHKVFFLSEDSGFHFVQTAPNGQNLSTEPEFEYLADQIHPMAPFPGTETGPNILSAFGVKNFFHTVNNILTRYSQMGHPTTRAVVKKCALAIAPLEAPVGTYDTSKVGQIKTIHVYGAQSKGSFTTIPQPEDEGNGLEIDNFLIPDGEELSEAALGDDWIIHQSPRSLAWDALVADLKVPLDEAKKHLPLREKEFRVGIVSDPSHAAAQHAIGELVASRYPDMKFNALDSDIKELSDVQTRMLDGNDAVVLAFDPERAKIDFWKNLWIFSSMIVGEQTRDKYKLEKPLYLINPKDEKQAGPFDYLEHIAKDLQALGTIPQVLDTLYHSVGSVDQAVERLKVDRDNCLRYDPPEYSRQKEPFDPIGDEAPADKFKVVIFVSATNESDLITGISSELATKLAENKFAVVSGAGLYSGMGAITKTLMELRETIADVHHTGYNVPHIMDAGEVRGKNIAELVDQFHLCRDIYERIYGLLTADAAIVAPGGMGTIQELAGFAMMKQIALSDPGNQYARGFADKELVIINSSITVGGKPRRFYDVLVEEMRGAVNDADLARLGIHVVPDAQAAVAKMVELRERKQGSGAGHMAGVQPPGGEARVH